MNKCIDYFLFCFISTFSMIVANTSWTSLFFSAFMFSVFQLRKGVVFIKWDANAEKSSLKSVSDGLGPSIFRRKMENSRPMKEEMDWKVVISRQSRHFSLWLCFSKKTFPYLYLDWRANNYLSRHGRGINRRNEVTKNTIVFDIANDKKSHCSFFSATVITTVNVLISASRKYTSVPTAVHFSHVESGNSEYQAKTCGIQQWECENHPRGNLGQNANVPRSQEHPFSQVCDEIEGRVTKKLSTEVSRTESCILGALSQPDEFLLNPLNQG